MASFGAQIAARNNAGFGEEDDMDYGDAKAVALVQMKGAPERILALCDRYLFNDERL